SRCARTRRMEVSVLRRGRELGSDDYVFRVGGKTELGNIEPLELDLGRYAQALHRIDELEDDEGCAEGPGDAQRCAEDLADELAHVAVQETGDPLTGCAPVGGYADPIPSGAICPVGEDAEQHGTEPTAVAMYGDRAAGIVDLQHAFVEENAEADDDSGEKAN